MKSYGYVRVSDKDQNEARQLEAMNKAGIDSKYIFIDKQSGKDFDRPQYQFIKKVLDKGDLLIIKSIDRLGRNYKEIIKEWKEITQDIGADIKVIDMELLDTTKHKDLLGTFISDLILQVLAYVAEQERQNIKQRQGEGIAVAKAQGKHLGRPTAKHPENWQQVYTDWKQGNITANKAMEKLKMTRTTFYKLAGQEGK